MRLPDARFLALDDIVYLLTRKILFDVALLFRAPNCLFEGLCPDADKPPNVRASIVYRMLVPPASMLESRPESIRVTEIISQWWGAAVGLRRSFFERNTGLVIRSVRRGRWSLRSTVISRASGNL